MAKVKIYSVAKSVVLSLGVNCKDGTIFSWCRNLPDSHDSNEVVVIKMVEMQTVNM
jgi:hypothetical protein